MRQFFTCALLLATLLARPAAAQTRRAVQDLQLWPELQAELALKSGDYLLLALHGENVPTYNGSPDNDRFLGFDQKAVAVAYEHFWSDQWSAGGRARLESYGSRELVLIPEALLRHRSGLGPLTFGQRLSLERTFPNNAGYVGGPGPDGQTYARLRVDLEKLLPVGRVVLRPRLSYEAASHVRLQKDQYDADERTVQFTSLRGEVGCRVGDHFDFTPWFAYTTAYYFTVGQFSPTGNPTGGGRLNLVTPVLGLDARFTLFSGKTVFERRQLPTQH